jgi:hypothetical protein
MVYYLAVVELHGGSSKDYDTLREKLRAKEFYNGWLKNTVAYTLPTGTYFGGKDHITLAAALADVATAATEAKFPPDGKDTGVATRHTSAIAVVAAPFTEQAGLKKRT